MKTDEQQKNRKRILIVDDEEPIRQIMQDILEIEGYHIETASSR